jgi:frataxin
MAFYFRSKCLPLTSQIYFQYNKSLKISKAIYKSSNLVCFAGINNNRSHSTTTRYDAVKSYFTIQETSKMNNQDGTTSVEFKNNYEKVADETLESLTEKFDFIGEEIEDNNVSDYYDVTYSSGVLTVKLGPSIGTFVLNKQSPNLQLWLSSPLSGPKRFDLIENKWIYKRTGESLHELLSNELSKSLKKQITFESHK